MLRTRLEPFNLEEAFRADTLAADKRVASGLAVVTIVFLIATLQATLALIANPSRLHEVWWIRGVDLTVAVAALFFSRRTEHHRRYDAIITGREIRTLQGIIPICSFCKSVRTDVGDWHGIEAYVSAHSDAQFSHGVCPECMRSHYPEVASLERIP